MQNNNGEKRKKACVGNAA